MFWKTKKRNDNNAWVPGWALWLGGLFLGVKTPLFGFRLSNEADGLVVVYWGKNTNRTPGDHTYLNRRTLL